MTLDILRKIGLSNGEITIYQTLLDLGPSPVNRIHEKTGIERRNIYDILNKLIERGLAVYVTENKRRLFHSSHPNKIVGYIEEKRHDLLTLRQSVQEQLPELEQQYTFTRPPISADVFRGGEGVKAVWEDMLNYPANYWIGSARYVPKRFPHWFVSWNRNRIAKKVKWYNIFRHDMQSEMIKRMPFERIKFLPTEFSGNPTVICIYGNKVVNFLLGNDYFAFAIESRELAEDYLAYHSYLWNNVCTGFKATSSNRKRSHALSVDT